MASLLLLCLIEPSTISTKEMMRYVKPKPQPGPPRRKAVDSRRTQSPDLPRGLCVNCDDHSRADEYRRIFRRCLGMENLNGNG
jgi:hypothetical protein